MSVCHGMDTEEEEEELGWDTTVSESHVLKAKNLIDYIIEQKFSEAGFGTCEEITKAGSKRKAFVFRKRSFSELDESRVEILKKIHIDGTTYSAAMDDENGIDSVSDGSMDNSSSSNFCTPFTGSP